MASHSVRPKVDVFAFTNYVVREKEDERDENGNAIPQRIGKDQNPVAKLQRMKDRFEKQGLIRSVEAVLLVNVHGHSHCLLLQHKKSEAFRLPGGKCRVGEDPVECLLRKLHEKLAVGETEAVGGSGDGSGGTTSLFKVSELLSEWTRPNFDPLMYPYRPPHITKEKEVRSIYLVQLAPEGVLQVRKDFDLFAIPLFELHDNAGKYGSVVAAVPHSLSRLHTNLC
jgi:cleavage and polyadenylation specificity factor subunit 5